jgi:hypothetical protein
LTLPPDKKYLAKSSGFNADKPYDRENAFLDEVAREKERVIAGLEPLPALDDELAVQDASGWDPLEFGQELVEPTTS